MSCVLRVSGENLDIDILVFQCEIMPLSLRRKGEPRSPSGAVHETSGANFAVSEAAFEHFELQRSDAMQFLVANAAVIARIVEFPGVQEVWLDFGVAMRKDMAMSSTAFPAEFIRLAGSLGIGVEVTRYAVSDED